MLPNFLIIGAPRSGTTTLYESLKHHPQIFLSPVKEPMFFLMEGDTKEYVGPLIPKGIRDIEAYRSLFRDVREEKAVGEASPCYLFSPKAPPKIKKYIPHVKIIALLRNPYSHYLLNRMGQIEPLSDFREAVAAEKERIRKGWFIYWCYQGMGYYGRQIERYFSNFNPNQFCFFLLEDLIHSPDHLFREMFQFLGIDENIRIPKPEKYNSSGNPKNQFVQDIVLKPSIIKSALKKVLSERMQYRLLTKFRNKSLTKPPLSWEIRGQMIDLFREDILKTQDLIHRDLSAWLAAKVL
jgi:hypothetical protein